MTSGKKGRRRRGKKAKGYGEGRKKERGEGEKKKRKKRKNEKGRRRKERRKGPNWAEDVALLVHSPVKPWGPSPALHPRGMVAHTYHPSIQEAEAGRLQVQGQHELQARSWVICLKLIRTRIPSLEPTPPHHKLHVSTVMGWQAPLVHAAQGPAHRDAPMPVTPEHTGSPKHTCWAKAISMLGLQFQHWGNGSRKIRSSKSSYAMHKRRDQPEPRETLSQRKGKEEEKRGILNWNPALPGI